MTGALSQNVAYKNKLLIFGALTAFIILKIIITLSNDLSLKTHFTISQFATILLIHFEVE